MAANSLIERVWGKGTVSSFVVVLLKVVESCWEYLEKGGVALECVGFFKRCWHSLEYWIFAKVLSMQVTRRKSWDCRRPVYELI